MAKIASEEKLFGKKTYTEKEVEQLLIRQREACAESITVDNLSEFTAKQKIKETKLVK